MFYCRSDKTIRYGNFAETHTVLMYFINEPDRTLCKIELSAVFVTGILRIQEDFVLVNRVCILIVIHLLILVQYVQ